MRIRREHEQENISRGSLYYKPRPVSAADLALMRRMDELHLEFPVAGARMLQGLLAAEGSKVGRRHVRTLMRRMGMETVYRRPNTSKPAPGHRIYPYLLRGLAIDRPNQVWAMDITYVPRTSSRHGARSQAQERADARGRHGSRPEGAHSAQDATASGRVISTIWRVRIFRAARWIDPAPPSSVPPKILESVGRHFGVSDGALNVLVPEVMLQGPHVVAIIGQLEPAGMAEHVRVDREWHLGGLPDTLDEAMEADGADRPTAFGNKHVSVSRVIAA